MRLRLSVAAGCFGIVAACGTPASARPAPAEIEASRVHIAAHVREASLRFGLPETWIYAVIRAESAGRTRAVSRAGAMGLMQLMPGTWARQRARFSLGGDPFDPRDNILAGTSYLREMFDRYGAPGFLAAYNAGPGRYEQWLSGQRSLPLETRRYVARIVRLLRRDTIIAASAQPLPGKPSAACPASLEALQRTGAVGPHAPSANPFGWPDRRAHDLFADVSTVTDR